ncbi:MAG: hypothetical protein ACE5E7_14755 [Anaerolineae bacterium]
MGLSVGGALIMIALAYAAQSPRFLARLGLTAARLDLRVRLFTGYALALLLLAVGFFLAGVPLGPQPQPIAGTAVPGVAEAAGEIAVTGTTDLSDQASAEEATATLTATRRLSLASSTPQTGAFAGPPGETPPAPAPEADTTTAVATGAAPTAAPPTVTATPTPTETPTPSPSPTVTPTPIEADTALISTQGSTLWVRRSPGGQTLALVHDGDTVILLPGHANRAGLLWREVSTVDGVVGWVQEQYLDYGG